MEEDVKDEDVIPQEESSDLPKDDKVEEGAKPEVKKEDVVPRSRLNEEIDKRKQAEIKLQETQKPEIPEDEKRFKELLVKAEKEKIEQEKIEGEQLAGELDKLHEVHGDFNDKKLLKIVDHYGCYDAGGNVMWERGLELYHTFGGKVPEAKIPPSTRTGDVPKKEPFEPSKYRDLHEIAEEESKKVS